MTGIELVSGIASSIVYDGLKRPFAQIKSKIKRNKAVNKALLSGGQQKKPNPQMQSAFDDVVRVLGNLHGEYTKSVAAFLKEIERSTIPDALKQLSVCGKDHGTVYPAFELIFKAHEPLPFSCKNLFEALFCAIDQNLKEAVGDPVIFEAMKSQFGEVVSRIDALSDCLNHADIQKVMTSERHSILRLKVAKSIESESRNLNVETTQGAKKVSISKLVIPARLVPILGPSEIPMPHRESDNARVTTISFLSFRRNFRNAVILGDPGGGKTTLTQYLCHVMAKQIAFGTSNPNLETLDTRDFQLPLKIVLRTFENRCNANPTYSILDYIIDEMRPICDNCSETAKQFLSQTLRLGNVIVIFDGLDEVLEVSARRQMSAKIEQFCQIYASCSTIVTSRIVGYKDAPLSDDHELYTLSRFNEDEVKKFSEKLISSVAQISSKEAKIKASVFLSQTQAAASDLRVNPLLLGLMVYIFNARGDVPNNRPEIYKECSLLMFEKWDQRRDIKFNFPQDFDLLDLFGFLAVKIFGDAATEDGVSTDWLFFNLKEFFFLWYEDKARSVAAAKVLLEFITGRAWVMCEIGPGMYKFTHRTFLEYFFARRIEEEAGGVANLISKKLRKHIVKSEWDVVGHLALQIATFRSGPKSALALDTLLLNFGKLGSDAEKSINFAIFIARSTEYLNLPESKIHNAINQIFEALMKINHSRNVEVALVFHDLISANKMRDAFVTKRINELAIEHCKMENSDTRDMVLYLLSKRFSGRTPRHVRYNVGHSKIVWDALSESRASIQNDQFIRATSDLTAAKHYTSIYRDRYLELYRIHGYSLIFNAKDSKFKNGSIDEGFLLLIEAFNQFSKKNQLFIDHFKLEKEHIITLASLLADDIRVLVDDGRDLSALIEMNSFFEIRFVSQQLLSSNAKFKGKYNVEDTLILTKCFFVLCVFLAHSLQVDDRQLGSERDALASLNDVGKRIANLKLSQNLPEIQEWGSLCNDIIFKALKSAKVVAE